MLSPQGLVRENGTQWARANIVCSNEGEHQNNLKDFLKFRLLGPTCRISIGLGWGLRMYIYNKFSSDADAADPGTIHQEKAELTLMDHFLYARNWAFIL